MSPLAGPSGFAGWTLEGLEGVTLEGFPLADLTPVLSTGRTLRKLVLECITDAHEASVVAMAREVSELSGLRALEFHSGDVDGSHLRIISAALARVARWRCSAKDFEFAPTRFKDGAIVHWWIRVTRRFSGLS
mmetsp:Transcript_124475/g.285208  ORF Transcript_124475/g.285208 Transcript_124475/m.285208 type:complete len:133 (-) Transcript_124475:56-454(-)